MNLFFSVFHFKFCEIKCVSVFKLVFNSDDAGMVFIFQNYSCCFVFNFVSKRFILRKLWNFKIFSNVRENLFRTSVFSNLFLRISPFLYKFSLAVHQTVMILQLSKKVCCHYVNFVQVRRIFLLLFSEVDPTISLFCIQDLVFLCSVLDKIVTQSWPIHNCFRKIFCYNGIWLHQASFFLSCVCLLKKSIFTL